MSLNLPISVLTDSYKAGHFAQYPEAKRMVAYGEFRSRMQGFEDDRILVYGMRFILENYIARKWTIEDVENADKFYSTHNAGFTPYPFPKDLFLKFVKENNGYFPVKLESIMDGSVVHIHTPIYQITAKDEYSRLVTFLETLLTMVWYPSTVATLSRRARDVLEAAYEKSVDESGYWSLESRLHDFGFRGCTTVEQSVLGGCAHLLNFRGSDTMSACYYAQFTLNGGKPVAQSIPATEHSVMTAWPSERDAILNMIEKFGDGVFATVMDSYDYSNALNKIVPSVKKEKEAKGGFWVLRPDSGDPVEAVLEGLRAAEAAFGADVNKKGYKVTRGVGVIQGDGINIYMMQKIIDAVLAAGYSVQSTAYGMGGGLLQRVNRDTMSFATKLSFIEYANGDTRYVMKSPKTDNTKFSLPGILQVNRNSDGVGVTHLVDPNGSADESNNMLKVVWDCGPVDIQWESFDDMRARADKEWHAMPKVFDSRGDDVHKLAQEIMASRV